MHIDEADDNTLLEVLANRGIDARIIREFSNEEIFSELTRRRNELDIRIITFKQQHSGIEVRHIKDFSMTEMNNEITRRRMEAEQAEVAMAEIYAEGK